MKNTPLRIAFTSSCVRGGGAGWSMYYLMKYVDRALITPVAFVPRPGVFRSRFAEAGVEVVTPRRFPETITQARSCRGRSLSQGMSTACNVTDMTSLVFRLASAYRRNRIDAVYCNNMVAGLVGAPAAQVAGIPCIWHIREMEDPVSPWGARWGSLAWKLRRSLSLLPSVKAVVANSAATAASYRELVPEKITVVHNGIDLQDYTGSPIPRGVLRGELGIAEGTRVVGFCGHIKPRKGVEVLVRAAAEVLAKETNTVFVVVGRNESGSPVDYRKQYEDLAADLSIADRFIFAGFRDDIRPAMTDFDMLCVPSLQEPFGRVVIEAMALGVPVIASRVGGIPEIIAEDTQGVLVPPGDADALAAATVKLLDDVELRERIGQAALERVRTGFDVAVLTKRMERVLFKAACAK